MIWVFLLLWLVLMVLLGVGTVWFQGYIYSEPVAGILWRAPVAGTLLTLILGWWCWLDYRSPGDYPAIYDFHASKDLPQYQELWAVRDGKLVHYTLHKSSTGRDDEYRDDTGRPLPSRPQAIVVKEEGEEVRFEPERDSKGHFKQAQRGSLHYVDPRGRVMTEGAFGQMSQSRWGLAFGYLFLNVLLFLALFGSLWLLLQFQWSHALGLSVICWLVLALLVIPALTTKAEEAAAKNITTKTQRTQRNSLCSLCLGGESSHSGNRVVLR